MRSGYITETVVLDFRDAGQVTVVPLRRARNITLRRKLSGYRVSVPYGITVSQLRDALGKMLPRLAAKEPPARQMQFHFRQIIELPEITVNIVASPPGRKGVRVSRVADKVTVYVDAQADLSSPVITQAINRLIIKGVTYRAGDYLLPRATALAGQAGVTVRGWKIGSGKRTLGTCSSAGVITLSSMLMFLPQHLRDYVVWHELAHRTHLNHSAEFHQLCNAYCQGREKALVRELKHFPWPVLR